MGLLQEKAYINAFLLQLQIIEQINSFTVVVLLPNLKGMMLTFATKAG